MTEGTKPTVLTTSGPAAFARSLSIPAASPSFAPLWTTVVAVNDQGVIDATPLVLKSTDAP
jgi:hypothetical protein